MDQQVTNRRAVAAVLVTLIRQHLQAHHAASVLRTALQASVPVSERPDIRRGLDGLVDLGVLVQSGESIGFTAKGRIYLNHVVQARAPRAPEPDDETAGIVAALLLAIDRDDRFEPYGRVEAVESLPARLEAELAPRKSGGGMKWIVLVVLLVVGAVVYALRR